MKKLIIFPICFCAIFVFAQKNNPQKFAATITVNDLHKHLAIIAGDEMEGRETGTPGQRKAAAYIRNFFKKAGLAFPPNFNGYEQFYPLLTDTLLSSILKINNSELRYGTDFITPVSRNTNGKISADQIVFVGYGIDDENYSDYGNFDAKGKIVAFVLGEPRDTTGNFIISGNKKTLKWTYPGLAKKLVVAADKGAVGALVISPINSAGFTDRNIVESKKKKPYFPSGNSSNIPVAEISHNTAKLIFPAGAEHFIAKGKRSEAFGITDRLATQSVAEFSVSKMQDTIWASNVLGVVEGSDKKDEYVFVTAHYDHLGKHDGKIYYGADDDGSGTVAVLEMAEAFAKAKAAGKGPRRTIVFMTVSGEEKGLWGSEYYSENAVYPLDKTSVDLNIDMIGRIDTERMKADTLNYIYVVGHDKISSELPLINEAINNKYTGLTLDYKFDDPNDPERIYFRSDHYNFARKGVPVLFFYDGMLQSDYHKPTDTVDKIYWKLLEKRTRMIFLTAWEMANRENMLKRDKPIPTSTRY